MNRQFKSFSFVLHEIKNSYKIYTLDRFLDSTLFPLYLMFCCRHIFQHIYSQWMYRLLYTRHSHVGFQYLLIKRGKIETEVKQTQWLTKFLTYAAGNISIILRYILIIFHLLSQTPVLFVNPVQHSIVFVVLLDN